MNHKIIAGSVNDICKESGDWMIVDVGFSREKASCGVWTSKEIAKEVTYGCLKKWVIQEAQEKDSPPLNLLLEAPLSVVFNKDGNPDHRSCDKRGNQYRDWYVNAGASTLVAAGHLLRALHDCKRQREVRLFEGLVSFKPQGAESSHTGDVLALKNAVWDPGKRQIVNPDALAINHGDRVESAFAFAGMNFGVPPVIIPPSP